MDKNQNPSICCLQETHFRPEDTCRLKVRVWVTIFKITGCQKKSGVSKLDFKPKTILRDEEGHYIIIEGSIHQEKLTIVNVYAPNLVPHDK